MEQLKCVRLESWIMLAIKYDVQVYLPKIYEYYKYKFKSVTY